ncbi:MAG: sigma-70 family RNA polymerase sigma factor [Gemmatimonadales bacterium]|nr:sigma-70 family RNA polymerase sigma factor [Gemmatimonadales bacterium]
MVREHTERAVKPERTQLRALRGDSLRERLIARDEQALVELIDVASPWLLGVTQSMLSDRDEAEEVVMDVFTIAWNRIHEARGDYPGLMPWLLRIARNRAIDRLRRRGRLRRKAERLAAAGGREDSITEPARLDEAGRPGWHVHESVKAALSELPDDQRRVVQLAYFEGLTHSEIATMLEIPLGTVKSRLGRAIAKLRIRLSSLKDWVL